LGPAGEIHAIDRDERALRRNERAMLERFPETTLHYRVADFRRPLELPGLAGIVMANSLHFQRDQAAVVGLLRGYLAPQGRLLVVEYNIARANFAVPHPVPFSRWDAFARGAGFGHTELLMRRPSRSLHEIYSAASW
ncbi:MAG: class I SAM-dependent methyltransferase, partial [Tepidiformaceae bacterium]